MAIWAPRTSFRERSESRSKLYWLDIDVTFEDITRQQQLISSRIIVRRRPSSLQYSVLHGVGTVANALSVGDVATIFDRFQVDVGALVQTENNFGLPELHRSARMVWSEVEAWIPERSATCLREADLNVLSKLGNQGLEWRLEPEAFTRREVRREDDLLDILVGCPIDIQVAWQPST